MPIYDIGSPVDDVSMDTMVLMLRAIIGDLDEPYQYTDTKLKILIGVSAKAVLAELYLSSSYTVTIDGTNVDITPELTDALCSLILLKAACMLIQADMRAAAGFEGLKAVCGPVSISHGAGNGSWLVLINKGPCASYTELKKQLLREPLVTGEYFRAILSPYIRDYRSYGGCDR